VDKLAAWAFMLLAFGYYAITALMAVRWAHSRYPWLAYLAAGVYVALLLGMIFVAGHCFQPDTQPRLSDIEDR
jgi:hypothetical protein